MSSPQARLDLAAQIGLLSFEQPSKPSFSSAQRPVSESIQSSQAKSIPSFLAATPSVTQSSSPVPSFSSSSPSLVVKAYALALKSRMIVDSDLSLSNQAVFVANIQNKGIPLDTAKEYANEAIYHHANSIQDGTQITFQSSVGDFFEYMNGYMLQVQDDEIDDEKITPEIRDYNDLLKLTEQSAKRLRANFDAIRKSDPDYKWQDHVNGPEGAEYRRYWAKRDEASSKLPDSAIIMAWKIFDSSHARVESKNSQNMPCVLDDVDLGSQSRFTVDPKDVIYRPAYGLSGFVNAATYWRDKYEDAIRSPQEIVLDLEAAAETSWRSLGFTAFKDTRISPDTMALLEGYRISLTFTGLTPFRIIRGLWNIEDFRDFTTLRSEAPVKFKTPAFRTDVLLLGYGAQMKITIPDVTNKSPAILPELLSDVHLNNRGNGLWESDPPSNDAYPILLAALASKR